MSSMNRSGGDRPLSALSFPRSRASRAGGPPADPEAEAEFRAREAMASRLAAVEAPARQAYWRLAFGEALAHEALDLSEALKQALLARSALAEARAPVESYVAPGPQAGPRAIWTALADLSAVAASGAAAACDLSGLAPEGEAVRRFLELQAAARAEEAGDPPPLGLAALNADHPESPIFFAGRGSGPRRAALLSDALMKAAENGANWRFALAARGARGMKAQALLFAAAQGAAAQGLTVFFSDRLAEADPLGARLPLTPDAQGFAAPPHSGAPMALIDARRLLTRKPHGPDLDESALAPLIGAALRMLDNAHEALDPPLETQAAEAAARRRVALRIGHVAEALADCGLHPGSGEWRARAERWFAVFQTLTQRESAALAAEKGPYPAFDAETRLSAPSALALDAEARAAMAEGLRCAFATAWSAETEDPLWQGEDEARIALAALARKRLDAAGPARLIRPASPEAALEALLVAWRGGANGALFMDAPPETPLRPRARPRLAESPEPETPRPAGGAAKLDPPAGGAASGRPWRLSGATYAVEGPEGRRWLFTLNEADGRLVEALIQIRGEIGAAEVWPEATARLISAALSAGVRPEVLAAALEGLEDPAGPSLVEGRFAPSVPAALAAALRRHGRKD
ncbi:hypothetical protein [Neomegalonema sp.]|uniref:TSCPD domain-containing protein n=1 Tax=Neomegalonema sp. TaxID=2039713 RepID=UPI002609416A|nr:hypothetical protein [Neomegalonema sp.]MDD2869429.1 hypothetical protein [Neomegalonema sp.]